MAITDIFKVVTNPFGQWGLALKTPLRTTSRTTDALLSPEVTPRNPGLLGRAWVVHDFA